jgi:hypothetical protein
MVDQYVEDQVIADTGLIAEIGIGRGMKMGARTAIAINMEMAVDLVPISEVVTNSAYITPQLDL